jgi:hypothetical protein
MKLPLLGFFAVLFIHSDRLAASPPTNSLSGDWRWTSTKSNGGVPESTLRLNIAVEGRRVHGIYCEITNSGGHIDCAEDGDNVTGIASLDGSEVTLTIRNKDDYEFSGRLVLTGPRSAEYHRNDSMKKDDITKITMHKERDIPVDRGACVITAASDRAYFFASPSENKRTKSYIVRGEPVLARGWSSSKEFLLATYDGTAGKRTTTWIQCREFDACSEDTPYYRNMPEPSCVRSLHIVE